MPAANKNRRNSTKLKLRTPKTRAKAPTRSKRMTTKKKAGKLSLFASFNKKRGLVLALAIVVIGVVVLSLSHAASTTEAEDWAQSPAGSVTVKSDIAGGAASSGGKYVKFSPASAPTSNYQSNLAKLIASPFRNKNEDNSKFLNTPSAQLPVQELYGPRTDYNGEISNLDPNGIGKGIGIFRATCDFSHFAYDDPIVYPGQSETAHLHMFWGNTHSNGYSTFDNLMNSGGSTCNGQELNRTSYWMPALIDGNFNVRIPNYIKIYYKSYGGSVGKTVTYPDNMMLVSNPADFMSGESMGFSCGGALTPAIPADCTGNMQMNVRFRNCWNGQDPSKYKTNYAMALYSWYSGVCPADFPIHLQNIEYLVDFTVGGGNTSSWFLSSDVDRATSTVAGTRGATIHGDWFGGWHKGTNQLWVDRCNNVASTDCETGYLGGRLPSETQYPALKFRKGFYNGVNSYPGKDLYKAICTNTAKTITKPTDLAYCR